MKIAITGASGLIGRGLQEGLKQDGHEVVRVVRSREAAAAPDAIYWRPSKGELDAAGLAGHETVINLAGENIFGVWTPGKKRRIRESRVAGTRLLAETIGGLEVPVRPRTLVNASAVGYYGDRPAEEPLTEESDPGDGFMAGVVRDWEAATAPAAEAGVRVVKLRFGLVLDRRSLLLRAMAVAGRLGLAATLGRGDQVFPWVTRDEIVRVVRFVLARPALRGPVNVVGREKVTNREFTDAVARVLNRPRWLRIPEFALRSLGELGDELLVGSWVVPAKLEAAGYDWRDPELEGSLRRLLGR